ILPLDAIALAIAGLAALVTLLASRRDARGTAIALAPLAIVALPWLPVPVPPAFLIWTGALTVPVWLAVAIALAVTLRRRGLPPWFSSARRAVSCASL